MYRDVRIMNRQGESTDKLLAIAAPDCKIHRKWLKDEGSKLIAR